MPTYHFEPLDEGAEVGVLLEVGNESRLHALSCTFDVHTGPVHLGKVHPLQVPQTPEENLRDRELQPASGYFYAPAV